MESGMIIKESQHSFTDTYNRLKSQIENNPNLKIILELDHQANAAKNDLKLYPTKIIMFGNPNLGTPLMQNQQTIGLDLPQKVLVYQDDQGEVKLVYNNPLYLQERHQLRGGDTVIETIAKALNKITEEAVN